MEYIKNYVTLRLQQLECKDTFDNDYACGFVSGSVSELEGVLNMIKAIESLLIKNKS